MVPKPQSFNELENLVNNGDIEIMVSEELDDGTTRLLICDHRRIYEDGEIYELIV